MGEKYLAHLLKKEIFINETMKARYDESLLLPIAMATDCFIHNDKNKVHEILKLEKKEKEEVKQSSIKLLDERRELYGKVFDILEKDYAVTVKKIEDYFSSPDARIRGNLYLLKCGEYTALELLTR